MAYSWARPAILVAGKGSGGGGWWVFLFLLFLLFHSCSSFFPVLLFHHLCCLFYLFFFLPFSGRRQKWPTRVDVSLNPNTIITLASKPVELEVLFCLIWTLCKPENDLYKLTVRSWNIDSVYSYFWTAFFFFFFFFFLNPSFKIAMVRAGGRAGGRASGVWRRPRLTFCLTFFFFKVICFFYSSVDCFRI